MKISQSMKLFDLVERMGPNATEDEARIMRVLLCANDFAGKPTGYVPARVWETMLEQSVAVLEGDNRAQAICNAARTTYEARALCDELAIASDGTTYVFDDNSSIVWDGRGYRAIS